MGHGSLLLLLLLLLYILASFVVRASRTACGPSSRCNIFRVLRGHLGRTASHDDPLTGHHKGDARRRKQFAWYEWELQEAHR